MSLENKPAAAPSSNWKEQLLPDEEKLHADHLLAFEEISKIKDAKYGKGRQLHRKTQLGLHGRFEVLSGLPDYAKFGPGSLFKYLFSTFGLIGGFRKLNKLAKALKIPFTGFATEKFYTATNIEAAAFDPWNALIEHRPLGEVMRARKVVYFQSQLGRKA